MKTINNIRAIFVLCVFAYLAYMQYTGNQTATEIANWPQVEAKVSSVSVVEASKPRSLYKYYRNEYIFNYSYKGQNFRKSCRISYGTTEKLWDSAKEAAKAQLTVNSVVPIYQSPDGNHCIVNVTKYSNSEAVKYTICLVIFGFVMALFLYRKRNK
ncbi:TPA: DUF3592 domain-containing protein [Vibrio parahaemolyticus]|nr:DUF3592 domain-containing protein [Vibrio parahaemolyticus]